MHLLARRSRRAAPAAFSLLVLASACGGARPAFLDDAAYFQAGADPAAVMAEIASALQATGRHETRRVERARFVVASFAGIDGRSSIRLTTARGLTLALDASAEDGALLALGSATGTDLDADGADDVVIERREASRTCLALVGIDEDGRMRPVPTDATGLDPRACIEAFRDLDHDGRVEALVPWRGDAAVADAAIHVPLSRDARGAFARAPWPDGFARDEIAQREAALEVAVDRRDEHAVIRLALEIAWIAHARGASLDEILPRFDATISRIAIGPDSSALAARARHALAALPTPSTSDPPAPTASTSGPIVPEPSAPMPSESASASD